MNQLLPAEAEALAALHARCFVGAERWSAESFRTFLSDPTIFAAGDATKGLILCRVIADEAELLTICAAPEFRQQGVGAGLLGWALEQAKARRLAAMHLEAAEDNRPAQVLYEKLGFLRIGLRPAYYVRGTGAVAAYLYKKDII